MRFFLCVLLLTASTLTSSASAQPAESEQQASEFLPRFSLVLGAGVRHRSLEVALDSGGANRTYSTSFSELYLRAESFPWSKQEGVEAGLFASLEFGLGLGIQPINVVDQRVGTSAVRFEGGAGWLFRAADTVRVGPYVGVGYDSFVFGPNPLLPSVAYTYARPGAALRWSLIGQRLWLRVDAGMRLGIDNSDLAPTFGSSASSVGFDASVELAGVLESGFAYGTKLQISNYLLGFEGQASSLENAASDGSDLRFALTAFVGFGI